MKSTALLRRHILARRASVCVLGQGYSGLTLACSAAEMGFPVTAIDTDEARIEQLARGVLTVPGVRQDAFDGGIATGRVAFTSRPESLKQSEIILVCVPSPVRNGAPDVTPLKEACQQVAGYLRPGHLIIFESGIYPGTTDELVQPLLETSGLKADTDFLLAYSPERMDPGNLEYDLRNTPKIVGGLTPEATGAAALFYGQLVDKVVVMSSCRAAELAKLLEDTFRHVNVALINEMAMLCHELGIDVWEVIEAAETKPFGFMPFYPGPGVGGHSVRLDGTHVSGQSEGEAGHSFRILERAQDVNAEMPGYVAGRIWQAMNERGGGVKDSGVLVLGVSYKADVGDAGESPVLKVMARLSREGAKISFHDPFVGSVTVNGTHLTRTELTRRAVAAADCVALLTPHLTYDLDWIAQHASLVFDARNAYGPDRRPNVVRL